jgi:hypothetical protein
MNVGSTGLRKWTQRFTIASAASFILFLLTVPLAIDSRITVLIAVFGFVCPMIFGMAYLLLPPYVGRTLIDQRLAGIHFAVTYAGVALLVFGRLVEVGTALTEFGALFWALGIFVFVGSLLATAGPVLVSSPSKILRGGDTPQRSTRLATATIPVAIGYLVVGTIAFLVSVLPLQVGSTTLPQVIHYYLIGFGTLLIYSLGARLLLGFFHVALPRPIVWIVLVSGLLAPFFLGTYLWIDPWFQVGAALAAVSMIGYLGLVMHLAWNTSRVRVGLSGIVLGAIAGGAAVAASLPVSFGFGTVENIAVHRTLVLAGFFPLTIVGYAYLFFPVSDGQFVGASARSARVTIGLLGIGVAIQVSGIVTQHGILHTVGTTASILGAIGYSYLLGRRFSSS